MKKNTPPLKIWLMALRPKTLTAAVAPMLIATAMAYGNGVGHAGIALLCLLTALFLQIGTNIANDYFDFKKGADTDKRQGPTRVTQAGLLAPDTVKWAFIVCFALAAVGWLLLIVRAGWVMAVLGISSILSGIFYTAGPKALGYIGLGDVFVFIFFGPVAVAGAYYAQALDISLAPLLAGIAPGLISVAILAVNNLRDVETDKEADKKTLVVRFGVKFAQMEYLLALLGASLMPVVIYLSIDQHKAILMASSLSLIAAPLIHTVISQNNGVVLNQALAKTGLLLLIYSLLFSLGWLL